MSNIAKRPAFFNEKVLMVFGFWVKQIIKNIQHRVQIVVTRKYLIHQQ
tara:strand:+ start:112 stop:255 length:144 start_codon:yes stop_codon:yes gene_type:complete